MRATAPEMSELVIGKRQWWAALCGCTFHRKGGECDCPDCTYITHNTTRLRRDMVNWHTGPNMKCELGCMDVGGGFREALVDVHELTKYLLSTFETKVAHTVMRTLDTDGDSEVSREEWRRGWADGQLTSLLLKEHDKEKHLEKDVFFPN